ncbi:MAG: nucleotide exchange factor GrpE [Candidatus Caccovivens sp.]
MKEEENKKHCDCDESCDCGCQEGKECTCGGDCSCEQNSEEHCECQDHENHSCCDHEHHHKHKHKHEECDDECCCHGHDETDLAGQYLQMAQRLQADFDNYRKHVAEQLDYQREEGKKSVIEAFLPCLDTFKEAKKSINDESVLAGIKMIEDKILSTLKNLKVEKIDAVGKLYDHNFHEVIAVMKDESKENDIILDEFQAGYTLNGKVIRYSKVIVNKL